MFCKSKSSLEKYLSATTSVLILISAGLAFAVVYNYSIENMRISEISQQNTDAEKGETPKICDSSGCVETASRILKHMDVTANPCDDFVRFACGNFRNSVHVPDELYAVSNYELADYRLDLRLRDILRAPIRNGDPKFSKLSKHYYKVCMDKEAVQIDGLDSIKAILKNLGGWPILGGEWSGEDFDWKNVTYKLKEMGFPFAFFIDMDVGNVNDSYINQKMLWLKPANYHPFFDQLITGSINVSAEIDAYFDLILNIVETFHIERDSAIEDAKKILQFEIALANISIQGSKKDGGYITPSIKKIQGYFPTVPWLEYINTLLSPDSFLSQDDKVNVQSPSYFKYLEDLLEKTPKRVQANYILFRMVSWAINYLSEEINLHSINFQKVFSGRKELSYRWKSCVYEIKNRGLKLAAAALYAKNYIDRDGRDQILKITEQIREDGKETLKNSKWLDEKTKLFALKIIDENALYVAYSENLLNGTKVDEFYADLNFTSDNFLLTSLQLNLFAVRSNYRILVEAQRVRNKWTEFEPRLESFHRADPTKKIYYLPAGILIPGVFFDKNSPEYMKFGSLGSSFASLSILNYFGIIFHNRQISQQISETYSTKVDCLFSRLKAYQNQTTREKLLAHIVEAIGVNQARISYNNWLKINEPEGSLPGLSYTPNQLFWMSYGNLWCSLYKPNFEKTQHLFSIDLPHKLRVLDSLRNSEYFSEDFNCPIGSNMNPTGKKCTFF